jgi:hypothetical protein
VSSFARVLLPFVVCLLLGIGCGSTEQSAKLLGEPCSPTLETTSECADGVCATLDNASGYCTKTCTDSQMCGEGFSCEAAGRFGRICVKLTGCKSEADCPAGHICNTATAHCYVQVSRMLCSPCTDALQCPSDGACYSAIGTGEQFCTTACGVGDVCPLGFACEEIPAGKEGALMKQCVPTAESCNAGKPLCSPCEGDAECGGAHDLCVRNVVSGERFCGKDCSPEHPDCPSGFTCADLAQNEDGQGHGPYQCVPISNTCRDFCDAQTPLEESRQCGLGRECKTDSRTCAPSSDGRQCSPCINNDDCRSGDHRENRCIVNDCPDCPFKGEAFCASPCLDDAACVRSFGFGFVCKPVQDGELTQSYCMPQRGTCASGLGRLGEDCTVSGAQDCVAGICLVAGPHAFCSLPCVQDAECGDNRYVCCEAGPDGYDCSADKRTGTGPLSGSGVCAPLGGLFGDDCSPGRSPCQTGTCLDLGTARVCTVACSEGCPSGFACREALLPDGTETSVCFPTGGGLAGADCSFGPAACQSGLCIRKESGPVCTQPCGADGQCPERWVCSPVETVDRQSLSACLPPALQ